MKIGKPKLILNPYEWLPGYGESQVSFRSIESDVVLDIEYERVSVGAGGEEFILVLRRELRFVSVRSFLQMPFPGSAFFEFIGDSTDFSLGELTEFEDSDFLRGITESLRSVSSIMPPALRHYSIQFLSENIAFHVLAEGVVLSEEFSAG